ncbi:hypothetical protein ESCO_003311 [Escovopsis weberi]|uniref:Uncharacterized protein n=1 Tax=Escovopsis weberi TaxID=150374 RepID=A0A0M9VT08_ESCWE|nr:hypothetical protein ESCO_003311 [Escovopsis weberi]
MRLGHLRRASHALSKTLDSLSSAAGARSVRFFNDAVFTSVAAWLAQDVCVSASLPMDPSLQQVLHPGNLALNPGLPPSTHERLTYWKPLPTTSTSGSGSGSASSEGDPSQRNLLHEVLSASHHLLEVTNHLQVLGPADPALEAGLLPPSQRSSCNIIRHLVIACHTMLLTAHEAVLAALQHDADAPGARAGSAALGQIRLVSVVQLCSYVIERQNHAVRAYLGVGQIHTSPSHLLLEEEDAVRDLGNQVRQRLVRLQQTLRI